jgi:preprotein translocase subunit SecA
VIKYFLSILRKIFGTRNDRLIKTYSRRSEPINDFESQMRKLTDAELRAKTQEMRQRIIDGTSMDQLRPEAMAVAREAMDRHVGIRNIFNPEHAFDPADLPEKVRPLYEQTQKEIEKLEPIEEPGCADLLPPWMQVEIPNEIYDAVRELYPKSRPPFRARPFDVQLIGGLVLSEGRIAEMKTGEGKTIVAPLACYLACVEKLQCYVVTVNDYLVQRDRDWVFPFYYWMGLRVGAIHPFHMQPHEKKAEAYECDVVYGTNSEFGFDYLRDNMKLTTEEQVQKTRDFCIIDEVDSILIDEARTPLIISGPAHDDAPRYGLADQLARHLMQKQKAWDAANDKFVNCEMRIKGLEGEIRNARDKDAATTMREEKEKLEQEDQPRLEAERDKHIQYYEVEMEKKASHLTHDGIAEAQKIADIGSFYVDNNMDLPHLMENALRAHVVYKRDKDYVVQGGEVVIVDEFTGRLMIGRQWGDGLHQAVESKEKVKIKEETQTLATVTIQNYFKLFKRLAGMTGTAVTEATEFAEIYKLEVVSIPTNVPVIRDDRNDLIYLSVDDKWNAILDQIKQIHDIGRPVLVGTTSVEKSEFLSQLLTKRYGVQHEVLNAKQHEREASIVENAGNLGAVMIATNMAGRGTDIKMAKVEREELVRHWQQRNILPGTAKPTMEDDELIDLAYRQIAGRVLGISKKDIQNKSSDEVKLSLLRHWVLMETFTAEAKAEQMPADQCIAQLDNVPNFMMHRLKIYTGIEEMGGLHIVGTERHEARRIDNQLRGRAGRQGDRGSSRFFIALGDDLMKMFAGKTTMAALSKLGMKEGDAIEHRWITKSVERAQRKVEERNYEIRKSLLEYDEVMEHQRNSFYGVRQDVLEGLDIEQIIFEYISDAVDDAVDVYLEPDYAATQISEWTRQALDVSVESIKFRTDDLSELEGIIRVEAKVDIGHNVGVTIGEYMSNDLPPDQWDLRGLSHWAMSRFNVDLKQNQLRRMNIEEVKAQLIEAADRLVDRKDLSEVGKFLVEYYPQSQLAEWASNKFDLELDPEELFKLHQEQADIGEFILEKARKVYSKREVDYPVEFILEMVFQAAQQDGDWAAEQLSGWAKQRYDLDWTADQITDLNGKDLHDKLVVESNAWLNEGKLDQLVDKSIEEHKNNAEALPQWAEQRFGRAVDLAPTDDATVQREKLMAAGRAMLRHELSDLERYVLLQILDAAWKDHLYSMDQLKDSVGLRSFAEKDPRIEYKREGAKQFDHMRSLVRDRVTDLIFRARLTPNVEWRNVYGQQEAEHQEAESVLSASSAAASRGSAQQQADMASADRTGGDEHENMSRKQRRAQKRSDDEGGGSSGAAQSLGRSRRRKRRR